MVTVVLPCVPGATSLAARRLQLETMEIDDLAAYAGAWMELANDYFIAGLPTAGARCVERARHYATEAKG